MAIGIIFFWIPFIIWFARKQIKENAAKERIAESNRKYENYLRSLHPDREIALYLSGEHPMFIPNYIAIDAAFREMRKHKGK